MLRPLRSVSTVKSLKNMLNALFSSFSMLKDNIIVMLFYYIVFSIAGQQIFSGNLKQNCFNMQQVLFIYVGNFPDDLHELPGCPLLSRHGLQNIALHSLCQVHLQPWVQSAQFWHFPLFFTTGSVFLIQGVLVMHVGRMDWNYDWFANYL